MGERVDGKSLALKKKLFIVAISIAVILAIIVIALRITVFGEPRIVVEFDSVSREVRQGDTFEISLSVTNEGGSAYGLRIQLQMPQGFVESVTGTNSREITHGGIFYWGDGTGQVFVVTVSSSVVPDHYTITVAVSADNAPTQVFDLEVSVLPSS